MSVSALGYAELLAAPELLAFLGPNVSLIGATSELLAFLASLLGATSELLAFPGPNSPLLGRSHRLALVHEAGSGAPLHSSVVVVEVVVVVSVAVVVVAVVVVDVDVVRVVVVHVEMVQASQVGVNS